jgi:hypothetical protein
MIGKELLFIIESIKKIIFYSLELLLKLGNVWERILIYHKKYKKDNILHLDDTESAAGF